jgi:hypothetical protein
LDVVDAGYATAMGMFFAGMAMTAIALIAAGLRPGPWDL